MHNAEVLQSLSVGIACAMCLSVAAKYGQVCARMVAYTIAGMAAWFFGNIAQSSLTKTNAFEVFYDGSLVRDQMSSIAGQIGSACLDVASRICVLFACTSIAFVFPSLWQHLATS